MKAFTATLVAILAVASLASVSCLRQYPRRTAEQEERDRYFRSFDSSLEPPRPEEFDYFKSASEPKSSKDRKSVSSGDFFGDEHYLAFFQPPEEKKRPSSGGKSQYHSEAKIVPDVKPIFDSSEHLEQRESKKAPTKEEPLAEDDSGIRCVKVDTKPVTADDVYKGRFRRASPDKTMTCYKCEDLRKGGTYQKCSYGTNPDNKAFFISHEKSVRSNEKPKNFKFGADKDDDDKESAEASESKVVSKARDSFFEPSSEYLAAASSIGKYQYDGPAYSSSNTNYRYEIPEDSIAKSRIPNNKPGGDHYQPSPSYFEARTKIAPQGDKDEGESKDTKVRGGKKPSENRHYSSYGERESNKGKKGSSEESDGEEEADRSVSPSEFFFNSNRRSSEEDGSVEHEGKPTEYSFSSSKKDPTKNYSYQTTDTPVEFYYETNSKDAAPSQKRPEYAEKPQNEYYHSSSKKQPTKVYSYETTDKPVSYAYSSDSQSKPKNVNVPAYDHVSPSEYYFSTSSNEPDKAFFESSSYNSNDDKPAEENAPKPQTVEAPKNNRRQQNEQPHQAQQAHHAPQVHEHAVAYKKELPDTFVAQPSDELKKALGEFHQKDRSNCTKVQRDKMTCWQCIDKTGAKHEECMYVASSEPKAYQTAYSDRKEQVQAPSAAGKKKAGKASADQTADKSSTDQKQVRDPKRRRPTGQRVSASSTTETRTRSRRPLTAATSTTEYSHVAPAAIRKSESRRRSPKKEDAPTVTEVPRRSRPREESRKRKPQQQQETKATEQTEQIEPAAEKKPVGPKAPPPPKPEEFEVAGSEGAFSAETRHRFDKRLGMTLPHYMLEKSSFEEEFDRFVGSG